MKAYSQKNRYTLISIITFTAILLSFGYYYFYYITNKEILFRDKAFRIIERVGENVEGKFNNYNTIIRNGLNHIINYSLDYSGNDSILQEDFLRNKFKELDIPSELIVAQSNLGINNLGCIDQSDNINPTISYKINNNNIAIRYKIGNEFAIIEYELDCLFKNTLRYDFFKKYIIFSDDKIYYSDIPSTKSGRLLTDTLFKKNAFKSSELAEIKYDNKLHDIYIIPVNIGAKETIYIGGIINKDFFRKYTFRLNPLIVTVIMFLLVLLILSLPFLKLFLISENERLSTIDAVLSFLVLVLSTAFIFLVLIYNFSQQGPSNKNRNENLKALSETIERNLKNEIEDILAQTEINDSILKKKNDSLQFEENNCFPFDKTFDFDTSRYKYALNTTWLNNNAQQLVKWRNQKITPRVDVSSRLYYQNPKNNRLWKDNSISDNEFYMEFIRSMTDGVNYAMISKPIEDKDSDSSSAFNNSHFYRSIDTSVRYPVIITMGSKLMSLSGLNLPKNYSYLLIDETGEVVHHKDMSKILQENLIEETNNNEILASAMYGRIDATFKSSYESKDCRFYIKPLGNLPLFLVVYSDHDYERINNVQGLVLSVVLYLIFFLIIFLQIGLFVLVDYKRRTKTKGYNLFLSWFWPNPEKDRIFSLLITYLILSILIYVFTGIHKNILMTFSFFSIVTTVNLISLRNFGNLKKPFYWNKYVLLFVPVICFGLLLFVISKPTIGLQLLGFLLFIVLSIVSLLYSDKLQFAIIANKIKDKYNVYVFLVILVIGLFPIVSFFPRSYNYERLLFLKNTQLSLARNLLSNSDHNITKYNKPGDINNFIVDFNKIENTEEFNTTDFESKLVESLRLSVDRRVDNAVILNKLTNNPSKLFRWEENKDSLMLIYSNTDSIVISSEKEVLNRNSFKSKNCEYPGYNFIFIMAVILLSVILFGLVIYWSRKVFLRGLISKTNFDILGILNSYEYIYVVSPPFSGAVRYIKDTLMDVEEIDLKNADKGCYLKDQLEKIKKSKSKTTLIFDSDTDDINILKIKTRLIADVKDIVRKHQNSIEKIVFISFSHPSYKKKLVDDEKEDDIDIIKSYVNIIADFVRVYYPLGYNDKSEDVKTDNLFLSETQDIKIYRNWNIEDALQKTDREADILNVQRLTQNYYYSLWNSMEKREHYLIYDIAQDGLANYRNLPVIYNLINKGILVYEYDGRLKFFNRSFQNFVLTIIDRNQALLIERESKQSGNWSNLQLPFIMVIFSMVAFIFITQQNVFDELVGWLTGAMVTIPIITRVIAGLAGIKLFKSVTK